MITPHEQLTDEHHAAFALLDAAGRRVTENLGATHPLMKGIDRAIGGFDTDGARTADLAEAQRVYDHVFSRDPEELRHIFNGWEPERRWPTRAEWLEQDIEFFKLDPSPCLRVTYSATRTIDVDRCFVPHGGYDEVSIIIQEGAPKEKVVRKLLALLTEIAAEWESLIALTEGVDKRRIDLAKIPLAETQEGGAA